ncbi:MAG: SUMF1/EgtB/PvdO family nonheme iron enzyme [Deltaproteobacteria bacterium]|nr:SUMF1/EgtB/PvdO family nonheme iron enzyme [Deltaproteobacteria bacterium]
MLCYRCGSHVPDGSEACGACGQKFSSGNLRQATGTFSRRKVASSAVEGAPFKPGDVLCDRYVIRDAVGAGPLGYVFKAQDKEIDVEVAVKVISAKLVQTPEERRAFSREIRSARKLTHNNLIRVYEDGEANDRPFFTMQFLDGLTLRRIIDLRKEKNQFFSLKEIEPIFAQVVAGLEAAHKVLPHTDFKPENVVVLPDLLKITDLGVGTAIPRQPFVAAQRARGGLGHHYLATEYVQGLEVDGRADVYSLGVLLGEMLANLFPEDAGALELRSRNPELPGAIEPLYRRATNENPLSRHSSANEFWVELETLIAKTVPRSVASPRRQTGKQPISELSIDIRAEDNQTPSVPSRPVAPPPESAPDRPRRESRRPTAPPPPPSGEEPAFAKPSRTNGVAKASPTPTDVMPVPQQPGRRRPAHTPPPKRRRHSSAGPLLWLAILGIVAGVGGGTALTLWRQQQHTVGPTTSDPVGSGPTDASLEVNRSSDDEDRQLEGERRAAEARRLDEERAAELRRLEEERQSAAAALQLEEEKRRKEALTKAFPGKDERKPVELAVAPRAAGCPAGMRLVPAGTFKMGSAKDDPMTGFDEKALSPTEVATYCIDVFESPNRAGAMPQTRVTFSAAETACKSRHKRLCSEEEWERACKGPGGARFPYGGSFDPDACNTEDGNGEPRMVASSGTFSKCRSAFGVADMSGNVAEWTSSSFNSEAGDRTIKGGAADRPDYDTRCAARKNGPPGSANEKLGFRCCADAN